MSNNSTLEKQIGSDLAKIDLIMAIGSKSSKRKALIHRKACFAEIARMNEEDSLNNISDEDLLARLGL